MNWLTRKARIEAIRNQLGSEWPSCINCTYFTDSIYGPKTGRELCTFKGVNMRPPAEIIAKGCPSFEDDVPF